MPGELIFVTGASGYVGSHVVDALLDAKYRVRLAARGAKVEKMTALYGSDPDCKDLVEVVEVPDIATYDFSRDFEGVSALIHTAAPIPSKADPERLVKDAIEGTLNVIRQAQTCGIKRVVYTSSIATVMNPERIWTNDRWSQLTKEMAFESGSKMLVYIYAKTVAEKELWKLVDEHPDLDVTALIPPYIYGPLAKHFVVDFLNVPNLSTAGVLGMLIHPEAKAYPGPNFIDVRDLAKAHVLALQSPLSSEPGVGRKRLVIAAAIEGMDFVAARESIATKRPFLEERLIKIPAPKYNDEDSVHFEQTRVEAVLGMKPTDFITFEKTVLDNIDSLLELEKKWIAEGAKLEDIIDQYLKIA